MVLMGAVQNLNIYSEDLVRGLLEKGHFLKGNLQRRKLYSRTHGDANAAHAAEHMLEPSFRNRGCPKERIRTWLPDIVSDHNDKAKTSR